jgi:hypothetical protein
MPDQQRLFWRDTHLDNSRTLADYGIPINSTLHLEAPPGLNMEGTCAHATCEFKGKRVLVQVGMVVKRDVSALKYQSKCPMRKEELDGDTVTPCSVANSNWEVEGRKKGDKENTVKKGKAGAVAQKFDNAENSGANLLFMRVTTTPLGCAGAS